MTFDEFYKLFQGELQKAIKNAEERLHKTLSPEVKIVLHGAGHFGDLMDTLTAAKELYIGEDRFYRIIDLAVIKVSKKETTIFVRASSHRPGTFDQTWNNPPGSGPFKQLIPKEIIVEKEEDLMS